MPFDQHKNLAISRVITPPSPADTGTAVDIVPGEEARFPAPPFNVTIWPPSAIPTPANAEVARVTLIQNNRLFIDRIQEGTTARLIAIGDLIAETITAKAFADIESGTNFPLITTPGPITSGDSVNAPVGNFGTLIALHAPTHAEGGTDPVQLTQTQVTGLTTVLMSIEGDIDTLQNVVANGPVALHAPTHANGGTDPVVVTGLAGYPGGTTNFLRADGTFAQPSGNVPGAHHATHEVGGSDQITGPMAFQKLATTGIVTVGSNVDPATGTTNTLFTVNGNAAFEGGGEHYFGNRTAPGADTAVLTLCGGGPTPGGTATANRGASISVTGINSAGNGGQINIQAANQATTGKIKFQTMDATHGQFWPSGGFAIGSVFATDPGVNNLTVEGNIKAANLKWRQAYTWSLLGDVTALAFIPGMFLPLVGTQTARIVGLTSRMHSGTSVQVVLYVNGAPATAAIPVVTSGTGNTTVLDIAVTNGQEIMPQLSSPVGVPTNVAMSVWVEYTL